MHRTSVCQSCTTRVSMPSSRDDLSLPVPPPSEQPAPADLRGLDRMALVVFAVLLALGLVVGLDALGTTRDSLAEDPLSERGPALP